MELDVEHTARPPFIIREHLGYRSQELSPSDHVTDGKRALGSDLAVTHNSRLAFDQDRLRIEPPRTSGRRAREVFNRDDPSRLKGTHRSSLVTVKIDPFVRVKLSNDSERARVWRERNDHLPRYINQAIMVWVRARTNDDTREGKERRLRAELGR
jgi:hypothetical protein